MQNKRHVGVMVKCGDKVLLCKRNSQGSNPGMWSIPGGKMEENETTQEGARREFFEETAVNIDNIDLRFIGLIPRHTRDGKKIKGLMYVYLIDTETPIEPNLEEAIDGDEHTDWGYFTSEQMSPENMGEMMFKLMEIILNKNL
jgi:ADP-ribose pyrophosphatase YjhB (NUDIX family)